MASKVNFFELAIGAVVATMAWCDGYEPWSDDYLTRVGPFRADAYLRHLGLIRLWALGEGGVAARPGGRVTSPAAADEVHRCGTVGTIPVYAAAPDLSTAHGAQHDDCMVCGAPPAAQVTPDDGRAYC